MYQPGLDSQPTSVRITESVIGQTPADWKLDIVEESSSGYNQDSKSVQTQLKVPGSWPVLRPS
jgi:hypothetical protein